MKLSVMLVYYDINAVREKKVACSGIIFSLSKENNLKTNDMLKNTGMLDTRCGIRDTRYEIRDMGYVNEVIAIKDNRWQINTPASRIPHPGFCIPYLSKQLKKL